MTQYFCFTKDDFYQFTTELWDKAFQSEMTNVDTIAVRHNVLVLKVEEKDERD